jgi:hypothetical protein
VGESGAFAAILPLCGFAVSGPLYRGMVSMYRDAGIIDVTRLPGTRRAGGFQESVLESLSFL